MAATTIENEQADAKTDANYWWLRLVYSIRGGDLTAAAMAQQRLSELGVDIKITRFDSLLSEASR